MFPFPFPRARGVGCWGMFGVRSWVGSQEALIAQRRNRTEHLFFVLHEEVKTALAHKQTQILVATRLHVASSRGSSAQTGSTGVV